MKISILIAAYNAADFIGNAINDALTQSVLPHEIIVVNDASTDNTVATVRELATKNDCIKIVDLAQNGGPAAARNAGIKEATGDWIGIVDADDRIEPTYIETLTQHLSSHEVDIIATNFYWYDPHKKQKLSAGLERESLPRTVDFKTFLDGARPFSDEADYGLLKPVFKRSFLTQHNIHYPLDLRHGEDFMILTEALLNGAVFLVLSEPLYLYTVRSSGFSKTIVDYPKMAAATRNLLQHDSVKQDQELVSLLNTRANSILKLDAQQAHYQHKQKRQYLKVFWNTLTNNYYRGFVFADCKAFAKRVARKVKKVATGQH